MALNNIKIIDDGECITIVDNRNDQVIHSIKKTDIKFTDGVGLMMFENSFSALGKRTYSVAGVDTDYWIIFPYTESVISAKLMNMQHLIMTVLVKDDGRIYEEHLDYNLRTLGCIPRNICIDDKNGSFNDFYWKDCHSDNVVAMYDNEAKFVGLYDPNTSRIIPSTRQYTSVHDFEVLPGHPNEKFAIATKKITYEIDGEERKYNIYFYIDEAGRRRTRFYDEFQNDYFSRTQDALNNFFARRAQQAQTSANNRLQEAQRVISMDIQPEWRN